MAISSQLEIIVTTPAGAILPGFIKNNVNKIN
jgi:hypothetical protein